MRILDDHLAQGFTGGAEWLTSIVPLASGRERRNQRRETPIHTYDFEYATRDIAECRAIKAFHADMRGQKRTWLLRDFADDVVDNEIAGTGNGSQVAFQIVKAYGTEQPWTRTIRHVKAGTLTATVNGVAAAIDGEVNGLVTLTVTPPTGHVVRFSCEFYVPVRFTVDKVVIQVSGPEGIHGRIPGLSAREDIP